MVLLSVYIWNIINKMGIIMANKLLKWLITVVKLEVYEVCAIWEVHEFVMRFEVWEVEKFERFWEVCKVLELYKIIMVVMIVRYLIFVSFVNDCENFWRLWVCKVLS